MLDDVNEKLKPLRDYGIDLPELKLPVYCTGPINSFSKYNAEVYGKPDVTEDISGTITNGIQTDEISIPLGASKIGLEFTFSPIVIEYDARKRMEKESSIQLTGGTGTGKISVCIGPDGIVTTKVCGDIDLYARIQQSTLPNCKLEYVFGYGSIKLTGTVSFAGKEENITLLTIQGKETSPKCLISK